MLPSCNCSIVHEQQYSASSILTRDCCHVLLSYTLQCYPHTPLTVLADMSLLYSQSRTKPAVDTGQRAGLPRRHERVHDCARGPPAARLAPTLLHAAADVCHGRLQPVRLRGRSGLLLLRQLRFPAAQQMAELCG